MRKRLFLTTLAFLNLYVAFSQHLISKTDGTNIKCKIASVTADSLRYFYRRDTLRIDTIVSSKDILYYYYKHNIFYPNGKPSPKLTRDVIFADSIDRLNKYFIYTYTGTIIYGNNIEYKTPFLGTPYLKVDGKEYEPSIVKFYKCENGFFANVQDVGFSFNPKFTERIRRGRVNLYETVKNNYTPMMYTSGGMYHGGYSSVTIKNYYNSGFGPLKKANYKNLKVDLASDPESMLHLKKVKNIRNTQLILGITGGALIIAGFATLINKTKDWDGSNNQPEPNVTGCTIMLGAGAGLVFASGLLTFAKPKHLDRAIEAYNR
jgi:hypothetical protein